jgi:hypothetical protein
MSMSQYLRKEDIPKGQDRDEVDLADWLDAMAQVSGEHVWSNEFQCWVWAEDGEPVNPK